MLLLTLILFQDNCLEMLNEYWHSFLTQGMYRCILFYFIILLLFLSLLFLLFLLFLLLLLHIITIIFFSLSELMFLFLGS